MKEELYESFVDGVLEIGNNKKVMKICEPNIMKPLKLDRWMVHRTLMSLGLFNQALKEKKD